MPQNNSVTIIPRPCQITNDRMIWYIIGGCCSCLFILGLLIIIYLVLVETALNLVFTADGSSKVTTNTIERL